MKIKVHDEELHAAVRATNVAVMRLALAQEKMLALLAEKEPVVRPVAERGVASGVVVPSWEGVEVENLRVVG